MISFPFAGIVEQRPYPPTGLTTARWMAEIPTETVRLTELYLTQNGVKIDALFGARDQHSSIDRYPHVVAWDGKLYLEDGLHRVMRHYIDSAAPALVMRVFRRST